MKKTIMFIIMLFACVLLMPSVYADDGEYATVEDITNQDTLKTGKNGVLTGEGTNEVTLTYSEAAFEILATGDVVGRPNNKAFVGIHITMPSGSKEIKITTQSPNHVDDMGVQQSFDKYFGFDENDLKTAAKNKNGVLKRTYVLSWKESNETQMTQTINIVIEPEQIAVFQEGQYDAEDNSKALWNEEKWSEEVPKIHLTLIPVVDGKEVKLEEDVAPEVPVNYTFNSTDVKALEESVIEELKDTKVKFVGFYTDAKLKNKYDWTTKEADLTVYMAFETIKDETNPATGDNLLTYVSLSVVALTGALGTGIYLKKVNA